MKSVSHLVNASGATGSSSGRSRRGSGNGGVAGAAARASVMAGAAGLPAADALSGGALSGGSMRSASSVLAPNNEGRSAPGGFTHRPGRSGRQPSANAAARSLAADAAAPALPRLPSPPNRATWLEMMRAFNDVQAARGLNIAIPIPGEARAHASDTPADPIAVPAQAQKTSGRQRVAAWEGRAGQLLNRSQPKTLVSRSEPDLRAEHEIGQAYDKIISHCLGLSNRALGTPWNKLNPYKKSNGQPTGTFKTHYLNGMLSETAFGAAAEFQIFVNQVNTHVLNIREPGLVRDLLIKSGAGAEVRNNPNLSLKGQQTKDKMWWGTAKHCLDYFDTAARQHAARPGQGSVSVSPGYNFDLLLKLQSFNVRFTVLERGINDVNFDTGLSPRQRLAKLTDLRQSAIHLQQEAGDLYRLCRAQRLPRNKIAFILGDLLSSGPGDTPRSKKVARFTRDVDQAITRVAQQPVAELA